VRPLGPWPYVRSRLGRIARIACGSGRRSSARGGGLVVMRERSVVCVWGLYAVYGDRKEYHVPWMWLS